MRPLVWSLTFTKRDLDLPDKWVANKGISISDFVKLAQAEKLVGIPTPSAKVMSQQ